MELGAVVEYQSYWRRFRAVGASVLTLSVLVVLVLFSCHVRLPHDNLPHPPMLRAHDARTHDGQSALPPMLPAPHHDDLITMTHHDNLRDARTRWALTGLLGFEQVALWMKARKNSVCDYGSGEWEAIRLSHHDAEYRGDTELGLALANQGLLNHGRSWEPGALSPLAVPSRPSPCTRTHPPASRRPSTPSPVPPAFVSSAQTARWHMSRLSVRVGC